MRKETSPTATTRRWLGLALASPLLSALVALGPLGVPAAHAGSAFFDFNSDPTTNGLLTLYGNASWSPTGGEGAATNANDGFLIVTASTGSQRSVIVFADIDSGEVVAAFTFEGDFRLGNGTQNPADGFSVNYVRANDPVLTDVAAGGNPSTDSGIFATGPNCEANLPEEGTQTGISVGFDTWNSGGSAPYCDEANQSIGPDIIGIDIRVDGILVLQYPMTTQNGSATDPTSIQTGPWDGSNSYTNLGWAHLKVVMDTNQQLSIFWKGKELLTNYQTAYFPSAGALVFAGRTGGSWMNQQVDNIRLTTIGAALALVGGATGAPDGFSVIITDSGNSVLDTTKPITVALDGTTLPPAAYTVTKTGPETTITYHGFPSLLATGSKHTLSVTAKDTNNNAVTGSPSFVVPSYSTLPSGDEVTGVDTTKPGYRMLPWQSGDANTVYLWAAEPNHVYWANEQIAGLHGANNANLAGATDGGYNDYNGIINFNINPKSAGGADAGQFTTANGYPDALFPGIPGANGLNGSSAAEFLTFLQFKSPGLYQMGVDSDDGFAVTEGKNPKDRFSLMLGNFDGGRGQGSPTYFTIAVTNAGIYPFRLLWFNGNGELPGNGAGLEWFTVLPDGTKILLNDPSTTNTSGVTAFYSGPALPAYLSQLNPHPGQTGVRPDQVLVQITDGSSTVNGNSISLTVDGSSTPAPTISKTGSVTTAKLSYSPATLLAPGAHTATVVWSDSANNILSNTWSFTVMPAPLTLDPSLAASLTGITTNPPGFILQVAQLDPTTVGDTGDSTANQIDCMDALNGGLFFPWYGSNVVDTLSANAYNGPPFYNSNNIAIWTWAYPAGMNNMYTSPDTLDFNTPYGMPGIPGLITGSSVYSFFAAWFDSYVVFPTAGFYMMGVASDDGFRLSEGYGLKRQVLHVTGTGIDTDVAAVLSTTNYGNGGFGATLPQTPITAPVVFVNSNNYTGGTIDLSGKIAVVDQGFYGVGNDSLLCYIAQTNGAVGFIEINNPAYGLPYVMGGSPGAGASINIPALNVNGDFGQRNFWVTNQNLTANIGAPVGLVLGEADYGKAIDHQDFGVIVPVAGAYPLHLSYFEGTPGCGLEWSLVSAAVASDGTRSLVNDPTDANSLLAYQSAVVVARPAVKISNQNGTLTITYTGTLTSSATVNGTYVPVQGAVSPYPVPKGPATAQFYRSHN